ncbi:hypothetical protein [Arthrobacter sp. FW306-04-A]|uniref:hypothetical protein n=1 Tax=Arthrobacter sp. FW306-04-A TaxID=2879619 RepID=UPI0037BEC42C
MVVLTAEITAWAQLLAFDRIRARRWKPKKLGAGIFEIAGKISRHARQVTVHLAVPDPETTLLTKGLTRLSTITPP